MKQLTYVLLFVLATASITLNAGTAGKVIGGTIGGLVALDLAGRVLDHRDRSYYNSDRAYIAGLEQENNELRAQNNRLRSKNARIENEYKQYA